MSGSSIVEDDAMIQGASLYGNARISGTSMAISSRGGYRPTISGDVSVYGLVCGNFHLDGQTVILEGEKLYNERDDRIILSNGIRYVERSLGRDTLQQGISQQAAPKEKKKDRTHGMVR